MKIQGIGTSKGLALGTAFIYKKQVLDVKKRESGDPAAEWFHYEGALVKTKAQLEHMVEKTKKQIGEKESQIFEAHLLMLMDEAIQEPIQEMIQKEGVNAAYAIDATFKEMKMMFEAMDNAYMRERAADMSDLSKRLIRNVLGIEEVLDLPPNAILFCEDLEPSDTAMLDPGAIAGFVTEKGGKTSHSAIIAQSIGIPAMTGIHAEKNGIVNGQMILMDAVEGYLMVDPEMSVQEAFLARCQDQKMESERYEALKYTEVSTIDGVHLEIAANIADSKKAMKAVEQGADGVGLFRTEFLYMNRDSLPTVTEQFNAYKTALEAFADKPMVIRTFDIGGDKQVDYLNLEPEMNPFLGYRAIRISLDRTEMFKDQLRALYMASPYGNLKIMFPMISSIDEIKQIKALIADVRAELDAEGIANKTVEIGIMVEIPVVAVEAEKFAKHVDFFSIGTNDLLQYTVAVDRMNEKLAHLYNWYHPGLLRLIKNVSDAAAKAGIWVGICGEAASDPLLLPFYVGAGIDELSMSGSKIAEIKWRLSQVSAKDCKTVVEGVLDCDTAEEVVAYLKQL